MQTRARTKRATPPVTAMPSTTTVAKTVTTKGNVEFNDVNFTLDVSGGSTVTRDQPINQAATASGHALESGGDGSAWKLQS